MMSGVDPQNIQVAADPDGEDVMISVDVRLERSFQIDPLLFPHMRGRVDRNRVAQGLPRTRLRRR